MIAHPEHALIIALDVPTKMEALAWVKRLSPHTPYFKVGMELFTAEGPELVREIQKNGGRVFLDLKYCDIPNTVSRACEAAARLGVFMLTVHASGGEEMLLAAREGIDRAGVSPKPLLVAVTVLTSDQREERTLAKVLALSKLAKDAGCDGVVSSGEEVAAIRKACGEEFVLVTPGIRLKGGEVGDQKRVMDPSSAFAAGSNFLVMGRGVLGAKDPEAVVKGILN